MALILSEGFGWSNSASDFTSIGQWSGNLTSIGTGGPMGDNYGITQYPTPATLNLPTLPNSFFFGSRINLNSGAGSISFYDPSGIHPQFSVQISSSSVVQIYGGNSAATLLQSVATIAPSNGWYYIEISGTIAVGNAGSVAVNINGSPVANATGTTLNNNADSAFVGSVRFAAQTSLSNPMYLTHLYMSNSSFLGDVRVQTLLPVANATVEFNANGTSSNWQNVSNVPPNTNVDYNFSNTVATQDTFGISPMSNTLGTIYGVNVKTIANKTDAGTRDIAAVVVSGAVQANSANIAVSTSFKQYQSIFEVDPNTSAAWTQTGVNAANIGYKITL